MRLESLGRLVTLLRQILCYSLAACTLTARAAEVYRFQQEDSALSHASGGTMTIEGDLWRLDGGTPGNGPAYCTVLLTTRDGGVFALNDANKTFFKPKRVELALTSRLFAYGESLEVDGIEVERFDLKDVAAASVAKPNVRWTFKYRAHTKEFGETINEDVWGEIRVWTGASALRDLPWKPLDIHTGLKPVDSAFSAAFVTVEQFATRVEVDISRRIEGGATLHATLRRSLTRSADVPTDPALFSIPASFVYREPVIGMPQ